VHYGFYVTIVFLAGRGVATAVLAILNRIVFQRSGDPLPIDLTIYPTFVAHALPGIVLVGLLVMHTAATLYHLVVLQDRPFRRNALLADTHPIPTPLRRSCRPSREDRICLINSSVPRNGRLEQRLSYNWRVSVRFLGIARRPTATPLTHALAREWS